MPDPESVCSSGEGDSYIAEVYSESLLEGREHKDKSFKVWVEGGKGISEICLERKEDFPSEEE